MTQYTEQEVKAILEPHHDDITSLIRDAFGEWVATDECRKKKGFADVIYPRTVANYVFDAIARGALNKFSNIGGVRVVSEPQTIKVVFKNAVIVRFKKSDKNGIGQNNITQNVLNFTDPQAVLPGFPPEAAKVEVLWEPDELGESIDKISVVSRSGEHVVWSYVIDISDSDENIEKLPATLVAPEERLPLVAIKQHRLDKSSK